MKGRCYPKYSYIIFYVLSIVLLIFALAPIFIGRNDNIYIRIGWSVFMFSSSIICFFGALMQMQTFELKDNVITIRTAFGVLLEMDLKNATIEIVELDTYFSWVTIIQKNGFVSMKKIER